MTTDPYALIIMLVWLGIWTHLYVGGPRNSSTTPHGLIQRYTSVVGVSLFLFYTCLYTGIGALPLTTPLICTYIAWALILSGALLTVVARRRLGHLSAIEVLFSLSTEYKPSKLDRVTAGHPMYVGMFLITLGSWILFPNVVSVLFIGSFMYGIYGKVRVEHAHHTQLQSK